MKTFTEMGCWLLSWLRAVPRPVQPGLPLPQSMQRCSARQRKHFWFGDRALRGLIGPRRRHMKIQFSSPPNLMRAIFSSTLVLVLFALPRASKGVYIYATYTCYRLMPISIIIFTYMVYSHIELRMDFSMLWRSFIWCTHGYSSRDEY